MERNNKLKYFLYITIALCITVQGAFAFQSETWKVLVYMQADNNLAPYALWDIAEIEKGLVDNPKVQVFTEIDLPGNEGNFRLEILPNKEQRVDSLEYYQQRQLSEFNSNIISTSAEEISQEEKLLDFLLWAQESHPTDNTMLVIWGHGEGWSYNQLAQFGGVALDDNPVSRLSIKKIKDIVNTSQRITNSKVSFLSMDACLMQTIEVASEFSEVVEYVSGSTQIQNFRGLPYSRLIKELPKNTPYLLAKKLSRLYIEELSLFASYKDEISATVSVVNTKELSNTFMYSFNKALESLIDVLKNKPSLKLTLGYKLKKSPAFLGNSRDLSNLIGEIQKFLLENNEYRAYNQFDKALVGLKQSIMSYGYGEQYLNNHEYYLGFFQSFGVWFPGNDMDFQNRSRDFEKSKFFKNVPAWEELLHIIFRPIKPVFSF